MLYWSILGIFGHATCLISEVRSRPPPLLPLLPLPPPQTVQMMTRKRNLQGKQGLTSLFIFCGCLASITFFK